MSCGRHDMDSIASERCLGRLRQIGALDRAFAKVFSIIFAHTQRLRDAVLLFCLARHSDGPSGV